MIFKTNIIFIAGGSAILIGLFLKFINDFFYPNLKIPIYLNFILFGLFGGFLIETLDKILALL